RRDREAERLGGLEVDDQLECRWLLDWEIRGFRTSENLVDVSRGGPDGSRSIGTVRHQGTGIYELRGPAGGRQPVVGGKGEQLRAPLIQRRARADVDGIGAPAHHLRKVLIDVAREFQPERSQPIFDAASSTLSRYSPYGGSHNATRREIRGAISF